MIHFVTVHRERRILEQLGLVPELLDERMKQAGLEVDIKGLF